MQINLTKSTITLLLSLLFYAGNAQDTLVAKTRFDIKLATRSGEPLKFKQLIQAAEAEELPEAVKHFKRARTYDVIGNIIGLPGAFIAGYQLGFALVSPDQMNTGILLAGVAMVGVQFTMVATLRDPNMRKATAIYNEALYQKRTRGVTE